MISLVFAVLLVALNGRLNRQQLFDYAEVIIVVATIEFTCNKIVNFINNKKGK